MFRRGCQVLETWVQFSVFTYAQPFVLSADILIPADGISIPSSYTAHIAPLSSTKLFNEVGGHEDLKKSETPYVVMFNAVNILSGDGGDGNTGSRIQECWGFVHPAKHVILNERGKIPEKFYCILRALNKSGFRAPCHKQS